MADAVTILARLEDRSELDVYEDLRRLSDKANEVDEATRAVHEKVRRWLAEEGWHLDSVPAPAGSFNIVALKDDGQAINVVQQTDDRDHLTLSLRWPREHAATISGGLSEVELDEVIWNIYRDVSAMGLDLYGIDLPSTAMALRTDVYFDGLTKDTFMHRIALINRAYRLAMRAFVRASRSLGRPGDRAASPEVLRQVVRPVPQTGGPLTVAS
jgi:hypothetical protein